MHTPLSYSHITSLSPISSPISYSHITSLSSTLQSYHQSLSYIFQPFSPPTAQTSLLHLDKYESICNKLIYHKRVKTQSEVQLFNTEDAIAVIGACQTVQPYTCLSSGTALSYIQAKLPHPYNDISVVFHSHHTALSTELTDMVCC